MVSGQISKSTVRGILARVFLTMAGAPLHDTEKFKDARDWALKVKESGEHTLNPDYKQIFINECELTMRIIKNAFGKPNVMAPIPIPNREGGRIGNENGVLCRSSEEI